MGRFPNVVLEAEEFVFTHITFANDICLSCTSLRSKEYIHIFIIILGLRPLFLYSKTC